MKRFPLTLSLRFFVAASAVLVVIAVGAWILQCIMGCISVWRHSDMAMYATADAARAVENFVRERRRWPTSWQELESMPRPSATGGAALVAPEDWDEMRTYVEIDFSLTLGAVANQPEQDFDAIKPIGPVAASYRSALDPLIQTVRDVVAAEPPRSDDGGRERNGTGAKRDASNRNGTDPVLKP